MRLKDREAKFRVLQVRLKVRGGMKDRKKSLRVEH